MIDKIDIKTAILSYLIQSLLSIGNGFYKKMEIPVTIQELENNVRKMFQKLVYEQEDGENSQSINDNEAGFKEINEAFGKHFDITQNVDRSAVIHDFIGGIRFDAEERVKVAQYLNIMDQVLIKNDVIQANEFLMVCRKK